jgi:hypothetical protein
MRSDNIFIREYLETLKEDRELDALFPLLLSVMGFRIVTTAKESKGQNQYGKDIVAVGKDGEGKEWRYYFELKGQKDKDITDKNYLSQDGVRESIVAAKDTAFSDRTIPGFDTLPVKIVFVHPGTVKMSVRPTLDGFIAKEFKEGEFERWDIYKLTDLFSEHLFNEYLLTDEQSVRYFKRTLALLDEPEYKFTDFKNLVDLQIEKIGDRFTGREFQKFFATQHLLCHVIHRYAKDAGNLEPAKVCLTYLLLKTWAWILRFKKENDTTVRREFDKLVGVHYMMLVEYFKKTLPLASEHNGLFSPAGQYFERVGYPLRSFEYLNYLIYFFQVRLHFPKDYKVENPKVWKRIRKKQKEQLFRLVENNSGCKRPLLDNHSIAILNVVLFTLDRDDFKDVDLSFTAQFVIDLLNNINTIKKIKGRFPLVSNDENVLVEKVLDIETKKYIDSSSLLINMLFELLAVFEAQGVYDMFVEHFRGQIDLQLAHPYRDKYDIEQLLFEQQLNDELYVEHSIKLPQTFVEYRDKLKTLPLTTFSYRTDQAGYPYLRALAHVFYKTDIFPEEWRQLFH